MKANKIQPAAKPALKVRSDLRAGAQGIKTACNICKSNCQVYQPGVSYILTGSNGQPYETGLYQCLSECDLVC